jgi:hypothetical protein
MTATMNWLRQIGVLLASKGLVVYCTLRLLMGEPLRKPMVMVMVMRHWALWRNA